MARSAWAITAPAILLLTAMISGCVAPSTTVTGPGGSGGSIVGTVQVTHEHAPITSGTVKVVGTVTSAPIDGSGHFQIAGLSAGPKTLLFSAPGFVDSTHLVEVIAGQQVSVRHSMIHTPPPWRNIVVQNRSADSDLKLNLFYLSDMSQILPNLMAGPGQEIAVSVPEGPYNLSLLMTKRPSGPSVSGSLVADATTDLRYDLAATGTDVTATAVPYLAPAVAVQPFYVRFSLFVTNRSTRQFQLSIGGLSAVIPVGVTVTYKLPPAVYQPFFTVPGIGGFEGVDISVYRAATYLDAFDLPGGGLYFD